MGKPYHIALIGAVLAALGAPARAQSFEQWSHPQDANGLVLKALPLPSLGTSPLRLQDMAVGSCVLFGTGVNVPTFRCGVDGTDYLSPATGVTLTGTGHSVLGLSGSSGNWGPITAAGGSPLALTWNGSGVGFTTVPVGALSGAYGSSLGLGPTALGTTGSATTFARTDQTSPAYRSDLPVSTAWYVDSANGSDAATNGCTTSATACKTLQEVKRRLWDAEIKTATTINVLGNLPSTDTGSWHFRPATGVVVTLLCSLGSTTGFGGASINNTLYTGTVTGFTSASNTPSATDTELTDSAIPTSYTASGLMAKGVIYKDTTSGLYFWAARDLGGKTIRISPPALNSTVNLSSALTVSDAYSAYAEWTVPSQDFGNAAQSVREDSCYETPIAIDGLRGTAYDRRRTWIPLGLLSFAQRNGWLNNVYDVTSGNGALSFSPDISGFGGLEGGMILGTGSSSLQIGGPFEFGWGMLQEGATLYIDDGTVAVLNSIGQYDISADAIDIVGTNARLDIRPNSSGFGFVGKNNTGNLVSVQLFGGNGQAIYANNAATPPWFSGATSVASPIVIGGTAYPVSALPAALNTRLEPLTSFPSKIFETGSNTGLTYSAWPTGTFAQRSGTTIVGAVPTPGSTNGLVANWSTTATRWFALDSVHGSDSNACYSDSSAAAAGSAACASVAALCAVIPSQGAGRSAQVYIYDAGGSGTTYSDAASCLFNTTGYANYGVEATGTQSNATSTAFDGASTTDTFAGAITVPGMNASGYNPTSGATTTSLPCTLLGGGSCSFSAEPAAPLGWRIRFDESTATAALRGITRPIISVSSGAVGVFSALGATPTTSDVFYIEKAGVIFSASSVNINTAGTSTATIIGIDFTGAVSVTGGSPQFGLTGVGSLGVQGPALVYSNRTVQVVQSGATTANRAVGGGIRNAGQTRGVSFAGGRVNWSEFTAVGLAEVIDPGMLTIADGSVFDQGLAVSGGTQSVQASDSSDVLGGITIPVRIIGPGAQTGGTEGLQLRGTRLNTRLIDIENMGSVPAIRALGTNAIWVGGLISGSTGNADVGLDLTGASNSSFVLGTTPTVTGTVGDVRLCDSTIISWATAAAGTVDVCGNALHAPSNYKIPISLLAQQTGPGIIGVTSGTATPAMIDSTANNQVLQQSAGALSFAQLNYSQLGGSVPAITSLTGQVTGTGPGATNTTLATNTVAYNQVQQVAAVSLLGNPTGSTANVEEITLGSHCSFTGSVLDCSSGGGGGTVTTVGAASGQPFTVANPTTTPAISLTIDSTLAVSSSTLGRAAISGDGTIASGSNTLSITGLPLSHVTAPTGTGLAGVTSSAWDAAATVVSTGLTRSGGNLTDNLATGVSGGQSAIGGTGTTDKLTLKATSATPASGAQIRFQDSSDYYDAAAERMYLVGTSAATYSFSNDTGYGIGLSPFGGGSLVGSGNTAASWDDGYFNLGRTTDTFGWQGSTATVGESSNVVVAGPDLADSGLSAGGIVKALTSPAGKFALASSSDIAAAIGMPANTEVYISQGTGLPPTGISGFTVSGGVVTMGFAQIGSSTGVAYLTSGNVGTATAANVSTALGTGSSTGILEATSGAYGTVTIGGSTGLSYSGTTLSGVAFVASGSSHAQGMVPDPGSTAGTIRFLREDASFVDPRETKLLYRYFDGAGTSSGATSWMIAGGNAILTSSTTEYVPGFIAAHITWYINVLQNDLSSGAVIFQPTRNGSAIGGTSFSFFPSTSTGVSTVAVSIGTGSSSATDTFGMSISGSYVEGTAGSIFTITEVLNP